MTDRRMARFTLMCRIVGTSFCIGGSLFLLGSIFLLAQPRAVVRVNGVPTTALGPKLMFTAISVTVVAAGLYLLRRLRRGSSGSSRSG